MCRELKRLDRPRKRKVPRAAEQNEAKVQKKRVAWPERTKEVAPQRLIFLDEMGISTNMTRRYRRAPQGQPIYTDVPYRNYKTLTVLGERRSSWRASTFYCMPFYDREDSSIA